MWGKKIKTLSSCWGSLALKDLTEPENNILIFQTFSSIGLTAKADSIVLKYFHVFFCFFFNFMVLILSFLPLFFLCKVTFLYIYILKSNAQLMRNFMRIFMRISMLASLSTGDGWFRSSYLIPPPALAPMLTGSFCPPNPPPGREPREKE